MSPRVPLLAAAALAALTTAVAVGGDLPGERRVLRQASSSDRLDPLWRVLDASTGYRPMAVLAGLLVLGLVAVGRRWAALLTVVSVTGAVAGTTLLKHVVERPRPEGLPSWAEVSTYSYPSGHATATAALALVVVLVARGRRWVLIASAVLVVLAGGAQVAAGLHLPADVVAGWFWAAAWTTAVWAAAAHRWGLDAA